MQSSYLGDDIIGEKDEKFTSFPPSARTSIMTNDIPSDSDSDREIDYAGYGKMYNPNYRGDTFRGSTYRGDTLRSDMGLGADQAVRYSVMTDGQDGLPRTMSKDQSMFHWQYDWLDNNGDFSISRTNSNVKYDNTIIDTNETNANNNNTNTNNTNIESNVNTNVNTNTNTNAPENQNQRFSISIDFHDPNNKNKTEPKRMLKDRRTTNKTSTGSTNTNTNTTDDRNTSHNNSTNNKDSTANGQMITSTDSMREGELNSKNSIDGTKKGKNRNDDNNNNDDEKENRKLTLDGHKSSGDKSKKKKHRYSNKLGNSSNNSSIESHILVEDMSYVPSGLEMAETGRSSRFDSKLSRFSKHKTSRTGSSFFSMKRLTSKGGQEISNTSLLSDHEHESGIDDVSNSNGHSNSHNSHNNNMNLNIINDDEDGSCDECMEIFEACATMSTKLVIIALIVLSFIYGVVTIVSDNIHDGYVGLVALPWIFYNIYLVWCRYNKRSQMMATGTKRLKMKTERKGAKVRLALLIIMFIVYELIVWF